VRYCAEDDYFQTMTRSSDYRDHNDDAEEYHEEDYFKKLCNPDGLRTYSTQDSKTTFVGALLGGSCAGIEMFWLMITVIRTPEEVAI
jgi:hypothetical protein